MRLPSRCDPDAHEHDWAAVWRALHGTPVQRPLTWAELAEVCDTLRRRDVGWDEITERTRLSQEQVRRFSQSRASVQRRARKRSAVAA